MDKKVEELSKGMQQKVQFIAAILHDPEFLILDEPFSGLDPANAVVLKDVLLELKKAGKTILFSTHRMDQVERLCDSICLVNQGKAVLEGELREIKVALRAQPRANGIRRRWTISCRNRNWCSRLTTMEITWKCGWRPGADAQDLLKMAASRSRLNKFELMEPSLEEIFIDDREGSKMRNTWLMIRREYLERVRTRSFLMSTILLIPAFMFGVTVLPSLDCEPEKRWRKPYRGGGRPTRRIGRCDQQEARRRRTTTATYKWLKVTHDPRSDTCDALK